MVKYETYEIGNNVVIIDTEEHDFWVLMKIVSKNNKSFFGYNIDYGFRLCDKDNECLYNDETRVVRLANYDESHWLEKCINEKRYIPNSFLESSILSWKKKQNTAIMFT